MKCFWRTKPAADEYVDLTDSTRRQALREAVYQATADAHSAVLRISGKPRSRGRRIGGLIEKVKSQQQ